MTEETLAVLVKARELLSREGAWTQGAFALDVDGNYCCEDSPKAACWCAGGAIGAAAKALGASSPSEAFDLFESIVGKRIVTWNDHPQRMVGSVLRAFDRAIKAARAKLGQPQQERAHAMTPNLLTKPLQAARKLVQKPRVVIHRKREAPADPHDVLCHYCGDPMSECLLHPNVWRCGTCSTWRYVLPGE